MKKLPKNLLIDLDAGDVFIFAGRDIVYKVLKIGGGGCTYENIISKKEYTANGAKLHANIYLVKK